MARINASASAPVSFPREVDRARVRARLDALPDARLVVLAAGSGYGKTTTLGQLVRRADAAVVWLTLTDEDADAAVFARRAEDAVRALLPAAPDGAVTPEARGRALALALRAAPRRVHVVLDDAHHLSAQGAAWLHAFVRDLPADHRVFAATFDASALRLARLVAQGRAVVLGPTELAFDAAEARALLGSDAPDALEGWPVGLALVASGASAVLGPDDLARDAISHLPEALRDALAEASVLDVWTAQATLPGATWPPDWLDDARRAGLPLTPLGNGAVRPHALLRAALDEVLRRRPDRHAALHAHAASSAEADGRPLEAFRHALAARQVDVAVRIAERLVPDLTERLEHALARRLLEALPAERLGAELRRHLGGARCATGDFAGGVPVLEALRAAGEADARALYWLHVAAGRAGQYAVSLRLADDIERLPNDSRAALTAARVRSAALHLLGRHDEARDAARTARRLAAEQRDAPVEAFATYALALLDAHAGRLGDAARGFAECAAQFRSLGRPLAALPAEHMLAVLDVHGGRLDAAKSRLDLALPLAEAADDMHRPSLLSARALWHAARGAWSDAASDFAAALHANEHNPRSAFHRVSIGAKLAEAARRAGDTSGAKRALDDARLAARTCDAPDALADLARAEAAADLAPSEAPADAPLGWPRLRTAPSPAALTLRIETFGRMAVHVGERSVKLPFAKCGELLAWLALHGEAPRARLLHDLWNGSGNPSHAEYLRVVVRRLRAALGATPDFDPVPNEGGAYRLHERFAVEVDVLTLRRAVAQGTPDELRGALAAVRGDFLPDVDADWADAWRARARDDALWAAVALGAAAERDGRPEAAIEAYRRARDFDPTSEAAARGLVRAALAAARPDVARRAREDFAAAWLDAYGDAPPDLDAAREATVSSPRTTDAAS